MEEKNMPIRLSGMSSGLDTEALVSALVSGYRTQKDNLVKAQTKLQWKQEKWSTMNTKIYSFYTGSLSTSRFSKNYTLKKAKISNSNYATVEASTSAVTGTQKLKVNHLATAGYLTGAVIKADSSKADSTKIKGDTKLSAIDGIGTGTSGTLQVTAEGKTTSIKLSDDMTVNNLVVQLKSAGLNASFDENNQRFFISSKTSGTEHEFSLTAADENGKTALGALGLTDTSVGNIDNIIKPYQAITDIDKNTYINNSAKGRYDSDVSTFNGKVSTYLSNIKSATSSLNTANVKKSYIEAFMTTAGEDGSGIVQARKNLADEKTKLEEALKNDPLTDDEKTTVQARLDAVKSIISLADDTSTYEAAQKLKTSTETEITNLQSTIDSNTKSITDMYSEAGFGEASEATYTIDAVNGKINVINADMANYVGEDGKIDTEKYTYDLAEAATSSDSSSSISKYKAAAQTQYEYAAKMVDAYNTVTNATESDKATEAYITALNTLGVSDETSGTSAKRIYAQDSEIELNGATFTNNTNTFSINGLTITATAVTDNNEVTISTENDIDGIYDSIKSFISDYNSLIKEIDTAYNAASAKGYEPLTSDEKSAMTDDQIKEWEEKIKTSLLRRDSTLSSISSMMKTDMLRSFTINGKAYSLSSFGISTGGYFSSGDNEKGVLHIDGDSDDSTSASNEDKLKAALASDPDTVISFFSQLADNLYTDLGKKMQGTTMRSTFKVYNDKEMAKEYSDYTTRIKDKETEISTWEDYYYSKFSKMESALASLNSQQSSLSGYFG
jgi:flagellar hook-associated protein 2